MRLVKKGIHLSAREILGLHFWSISISHRPSFSLHPGETIGSQRRCENSTARSKNRAGQSRAGGCEGVRWDVGAWVCDACDFAWERGDGWWLGLYDEKKLLFFGGGLRWDDVFLSFCRICDWLIDWSKLLWSLWVIELLSIGFIIELVSEYCILRVWTGE